MIPIIHIFSPVLLQLAAGAGYYGVVFETIDADGEVVAAEEIIPCDNFAAAADLAFVLNATDERAS